MSNNRLLYSRKDKIGIRTEAIIDGADYLILEQFPYDSSPDRSTIILSPAEIHLIMKRYKEKRKKSFKGAMKD